MAQAGFCLDLSCILTRYIGSEQGSCGSPRKMLDGGGRGRGGGREEGRRKQ